MDNKQTLQTQLAEALKVLQRYEDRAPFSNKPRNMNLVFGNTGAGKTTTAKLYTQPSSLDVCEKHCVNCIVDAHDESISDRTISHSQIPQCYGKSTDETFCDLPGFFDNRGEGHEMVDAYFIQDIAKYADRVKFLLVVDVSSVTATGNRIDFPNLLSQLTCIIKDPAKFVNSFTLIATKVPFPAQKVDQQIEAYLNLLLSDLKTHFPESVQRKKARTIIKSLLTKDTAGDLQHITFMQRPDKVGKLDADKDVMDQLKEMRRTLNSNCEFASVREEDFQLCLSPSTRLFAEKLVQFVNVSETEIFQCLGQMLSTPEHAENYNDICKTIKRQLNLAKCIRVAIEGIPPPTICNIRETFLRHVQDVFKEIPGVAMELQKISKTEEILRSLENIVGTKFTHSPLGDWILPIRQALIVTEAAISRLRERFLGHILNIMARAFYQIQREFPKPADLNLDPAGLEKYKVCRTYIRKLKGAENDAQNSRTLYDFISFVSKALDELPFSTREVQDLRHDGISFEDFFDPDGMKKELIEPYKLAIAHLEEVQAQIDVINQSQSPMSQFNNLPTWAAVGVAVISAGCAIAGRMQK